MDSPTPPTPTASQSGATSKEAPLLGWLIVIDREGTTHATYITDNAKARAYFEEASAQWSDSYLCRVVTGPRDVVGEHPRLPDVFNEVMSALSAAHETIAGLRETINAARALVDVLTVDVTGMHGDCHACGATDGHDDDCGLVALAKVLTRPSGEGAGS